MTKTNWIKSPIINGIKNSQINDTNPILTELDTHEATNLQIFVKLNSINSPIKKEIIDFAICKNIAPTIKLNISCI